MTTTHVFIVDTNTFKYHLEYLFVGTGTKDSSINFNNNSNTFLDYTTENNLVGNVADSQRIRKGDFVIFLFTTKFTLKKFGRVNSMEFLKPKKIYLF